MTTSQYRQSAKLSGVGPIFGLMRDVQPTDSDLIAFAGLRYNHAGAQEAAIRREFDLTANRFWQQVFQILDSPARIAALDPSVWPVVKRLDEQRQGRQEQRRPLAG